MTDHQQQHPTTSDNNEHSQTQQPYSPSIFQLNNDHESSSSSCIDPECWPNLYDETYDMILASIMVYGLVDLRTLARNGTLSIASGDGDNNVGASSPSPPPAVTTTKSTITNRSIVQKLLELPISADEILKLVLQNRQQIEDEIGPESTQLYLTTFDNLVESRHTSKTSTTCYSYRHDSSRRKCGSSIHSRDQQQQGTTTTQPATKRSTTKDPLSDTNDFHEDLLHNDHHYDVESQQQQQQQQVQQQRQQGESTVDASTSSSSALQIVVVDDNNAEEELVYGICVNTTKQYITVIFRGATTTKDWKVCYDPLMIQQSIELPIVTSSTANNESNTTTATSHHHGYYCGGNDLYVGACVGACVNNNDENHENRTHETHVVSIHRGFYNYLFSRLRHNVNHTHTDEDEEQVVTDDPTNTPSANNSNTTCTNKFECICDHLERLLQIYPNYKVYITGHSLGGALATVCAFELAVKWSKLSTSATSTSYPNRQQHKKRIVTCIPFGNPMVGNLQFQQVFETLEDMGILRCIRVTNYFDIFTQLPDRGSYVLYSFMIYWGCAIGPFFILYYIVWSFLFFLFCQHRVYRHVGMDLHLYNVKNTINNKFDPTAAAEDALENNNYDDDDEIQGRGGVGVGGGGGTVDDMKQNLQNFFKIKRSDHFSSRNLFAKRLLSDWKRLWKQTIQRLVYIPCSYTCAWCDYFDVFNWKQDFHINHGAKEHLRRLSIMKEELSTLYLNDLYTQRRQQQQQPHGQQHPQPLPVDQSGHSTTTRRSYTIESRHDGVTLQLVPMMSTT